jgi:hypothetical protein
MPSIHSHAKKVGVRRAPSSRMIPSADSLPMRNGFDCEGVASQSPSRTLLLIARSKGPTRFDYTSVGQVWFPNSTRVIGFFWRRTEIAISIRAFGYPVNPLMGWSTGRPGRLVTYVCAPA